MKHIILIHALFMKSFTMKILGNKLNASDPNIKIHYFDYKSTKFSNNTLEDLNNLVKSIKLSKDDEISLVGHSMGGLISRLYLTQYNPENVKSVITLGTPHHGSALGKFLHQTPFSTILGTSGKSGIIEKIPDWNNQYDLYCIAGSFNYKLFLNLFHLNDKNEDNDGTVFVKEALLDNSTKNIIVNNTAHMQLLFSNEVFNEIKAIINL